MTVMFLRPARLEISERFLPETPSLWLRASAKKSWVVLAAKDSMREKTGAISWPGRVYGRLSSGESIQPKR